MQFQIIEKNKRKIKTLMYFSGVLALIIFLFLYFTFGYLTWWATLIILFFFGCIQIGPGIYLLYEYKKVNEDYYLRLSKGEVTFGTLDQRHAYSFDKNEIEKIDLYIPPNNYRNTITFSSMEDFSFARFELKDNKEFYLTCLMVPENNLNRFLEDYFSQVLIKVHPWRIFPSIRLVNAGRKKKKMPVLFQEEKKLH